VWGSGAHATATGGVGYGACVDVAAPDPVVATVESEIFAVAGFVLEVDLVEAAARGGNGPEVALEVVDLAAIEGKQATRRALADGLGLGLGLLRPGGLPGGFVPIIG
jgi:hypothetical protein